MSAELHRLEQQRDDAADRLHTLLAQREAALEGKGVAPSVTAIERARAMLEIAEGILATFCRTGVNLKEARLD